VSSEGLHEERDVLKPETVDRHRAIASLMEELEAVDWYDQRVDGCTDEELRAVLAHNRDEEKEHAAMVLEWLRRKAPGFEAELRTYLFTEGPITEVEEAAMSGADGAPGGGEASEAGASATQGAGDGSLGIGSLRGAVGE